MRACLGVCMLCVLSECMCVLSVYMCVLTHTYVCFMCMHTCVKVFRCIYVSHVYICVLMCFESVVCVLELVFCTCLCKVVLLYWCEYLNI